MKQKKNEFHDNKKNKNTTIQQHRDLNGDWMATEQQ